jgi:hypothetical protein
MLKQELLQTPVSGERRELRTLPGPEAAPGPSWSEIQIAASADGKTVVVGSNGGTAFSSNYGDSFSPSSTFTFNEGDPTLARGASGRFYLSGINITASACTNPVAVNASGNGALFALTGMAASCPTTGSSCFPDQPQMAADGINSSATGDQLYIVRREFSPWLIHDGCLDMPFLLRRRNAPPSNARNWSTGTRTLADASPAHPNIEERAPTRGAGIAGRLRMRQL